MLSTTHTGVPLMAQMVKNLPTMQEARVQCMGQEDPLEKGMATHSRNSPWGHKELDTSE